MSEFQKKEIAIELRHELSDWIYWKRNPDMKRRFPFGEDSFIFEFEYFIILAMMKIL